MSSFVRPREPQIRKLCCLLRQRGRGKTPPLRPPVAKRAIVGIEGRVGMDPPANQPRNHGSLRSCRTAAARGREQRQCSSGNHRDSSRNMAIIIDAIKSSSGSSSRTRLHHNGPPQQPSSQQPRPARSLVVPPGWPCMGRCRYGSDTVSSRQSSIRRPITAPDPPAQPARTTPLASCSPQGPLPPAGC